MIMKHLFKQKKPPVAVECDPVLNDLRRGQEGRLHADNYLSKEYFEKPEILAEIGFEDNAGHNFLGIIGGKTETVQRDDGRLEKKTTGGVPIGVLDDRHATTFAGSRAGKGRGIIIPQLLSYAGSVIVNDVKGENTAVTARYRAEVLGHKVYVIDPFCMTPAHCAKYRRQFNPMTLLSPDNLNSVADAGLIADAIVAAVSEKDPHWDESAKNLIEALLLMVATGAFPPKQKILKTVYDLLSGKVMGIEDLIAEMQENPSLDGRIVAAGRALSEMSSKERGSVLSTARRHMKFMDYDGIGKVFGGHDFDLNDLKKRPTTIYLVLPATRLSACKGLLRLFFNLTLGMVEVETTKPKYPILALIDEATVLGRMAQLEDAIGQVAGLGLRIHCIFQDINQLRAIYKERHESFLANSGVLCFFGLVDHTTSQWVSQYLGKTTIRATDRNATSVDDKMQGRSGVSYRSQTVDLMTASEVRRYFARDDHYSRMLVLIPGKRPWILQRAHYDQHELFKGRFDQWR